MPNASNGSGKQAPVEQRGITRITVAGFKSISDEQSIEVKPLTILAGANSTGKSSIMQPLMLIKQTLESTYDPGALRLDGPNVYFTSIDQLLSYASGQRRKEFSVGIEVATVGSIKLLFTKQLSKGFDIQELVFATKHQEVRLTRQMSHDDIISSVPFLKGFEEQVLSKMFPRADQLFVFRNRCFLNIGTKNNSDSDLPGGSVWVDAARIEDFEYEFHDIVHLPALRGNPERTYRVTAVGENYPGTFDVYTASVIAHWQEQNDPAIDRLAADLKRLGLTWKVEAKRLNDTQVELKVGRLPNPARGGAHDLVSIADVGFGVSQTLPVIVALHVAQPGQLVYLEQPEIHLHPRAQSIMAAVIADAVVNRNIKVVVETHSNLLLLGIQTMIAEGKLSPELVKLHWFKRRDDGSTEITSADLDENGAFGDWPEDFGQVELDAENRYLSAAEEASQRS